MKSSDKMNKSEEEIIKMLIERISIAKNLTPAKIRMRKCRSLLRNMMKTNYNTLDMTK
jgi:hypothetical protein